MKKIRKNELELIIGGSSLSATMINALTNVLKVIIESGKGLGSSLRRFGENKTCPLE